MTDSLPFLTDGAAPANPAAPPPRKCTHRGQWTTADNLGPFKAWPVCTSGPACEQAHVTLCRRCGKRKADAATVSRVRRASARGFRTSADLAAYLGGQNVDKLGWPWDVQGRGYRIQSKRLAVRPSGRAFVALLDAIPYRTDDLRAVFYVPPRARLTSGIVVVAVREWVDQHGWEVPREVRPLHAAERLLLEMPLPTFRDLHIGRTDQ